MPMQENISAYGRWSIAFECGPRGNPTRIALLIAALMEATNLGVVFDGLYIDVVLL